MSSRAVRTVDDITYEAETHVSGHSPVTIRATVTATNTTDRTVELGYGDCSLRQIRAYRGPDRSEPPVWEWDVLRDRGVCLDYLALARLAPGESHTFEVTATASLPSIPRYFIVWLEVSHPSRRTIELEA
jgi:hypothetical protein